MSTFTKFTTKLKLIHLPLQSKRIGRDTYSVTTPFIYYTSQLNHLNTSEETLHAFASVARGFVTDGATIPRIFHWILPPLGRYGQAAVLHDNLLIFRTCYMTRHNPTHIEEDEISDLLKDSFVISITRKDADNMFNEAMKVLEINPLKRFIMYHGVRIYSKYFSSNRF